MSKLTLNAVKLREYMNQKQLTEAELARKMDVSRSTVNRVLRGKRGAGTEFIGKLLETFPEVGSLGLINLHPSRRPVVNSRNGMVYFTNQGQLSSHDLT